MQTTNKHLCTYSHIVILYTGSERLLFGLSLARKVAVQVVQCPAGNWNTDKHQATPQAGTGKTGRTNAMEECEMA